MVIKLFTLMFLFAILFSSILSAIEPSSSPICKINGIIKNIERKNASPGQGILDGLALKVKINEVYYVGGDFMGKNCLEIYPIGSELIFFLEESMINTLPEINQTIEGEVKFDKNKYFLNYGTVDSSSGEVTERSLFLRLIDKIINFFKSLF